MKILTLKERGEWKNYLERLPLDQQDIYYSPDYYELYEKLGDGEAKCFVYSEEDKLALYPFLMNQVDSDKYGVTGNYYDIQGAYGYNGAVSNCADEKFISSFNQSFNAYSLANNILAEFTRFNPLLNNSEFFEERMEVLTDRETVLLDLRPDLEEIWSKEFQGPVRNKIRKALNRGYYSQILKNPSEKDIETFISIYHENMKLVNAEKYYFFNKVFFYNTFKKLGSHAYLLNIRNEMGEVVSSTILLACKDYFHYHLSGRKEDNKSWVSNFLFSEAIELAKKEGAKYFHLGGGRSNRPDDSLLRFKKGFSKSLGVFALGKKINFPEVYNKIEQQWNVQNPSIKENYTHYLLKYRIEEDGQKTVPPRGIKIG